MSAFFAKRLLGKFKKKGILKNSKLLNVTLDQFFIVLKYYKNTNEKERMNKTSEIRCR